MCLLNYCPTDVDPLGLGCGGGGDERGTEKNVENNSKCYSYPHLKTLFLWIDKDKLKGGNLGGLSSTYINYYGNLPYHTMTLW